MSADLNEMDDEGGTKQTLTRWLARQHSKGHDTSKLLSEIRQYVPFETWAAAAVNLKKLRSQLERGDYSAL